MCITIIRIVHLEECITFFIFNLITLYGEKMFYITYDIQEMDVESGDSVSFETDYGFFDGTGEATVNITGTPVIQKKGKVNLKSDRYYQNPVKEDLPVENQFISLVSQGRLLAESIMAVSEYRIYNEIYERGRPDLEAGDLIEIENEFGVIRNALIFELNIEYDSNGFLEGFMKVYGKGD